MEFYTCTKSTMNLLVVSFIYLDCKSSKDDSAENRISENAIKHILLSMNLASIDFIEELHQDKCVKDDGVVLRRRGMQWSVSATVDVKYGLP